MAKFRLGAVEARWEEAGKREVPCMQKGDNRAKGSKEK
jgi:hypothetical protein